MYQKGESMTIDEGAWYLDSHEWARDDQGLITIGISDYAQDSLGDIVFVELPKVGTTLTKGGVLGVVESVKAASDVYSPVTGEVIEINRALVDNPGLVNRDAFGEGWFAKIKPGAGFAGLMDPKAYKIYCAGL
jgi:glycine cleavage system H protein